MPKTSVEPVDAYVGTRVRARRQQLGMSQTALAVGLGVSFQQVQKYEKGANRIAASRLARIAELLQVQVPYFYEGAPGGKSKASQVSQDAALTKFLSRKGQILVEACNELPGPLLAALVHFAQDLAKATARQK
jgi:transcriptional regulator with XRE-family HTH domain